MLNYFRNQQLQPLLLQQQCWQIVTVIQHLHILHPSVLYLTGKECSHLVRAAKLGVVMQIMSQLVVMTLLAKSQLNQSTSIPTPGTLLTRKFSMEWVLDCWRQCGQKCSSITATTDTPDHHFHSYDMKDRVNLSSASNLVL